MNHKPLISRYLYKSPYVEDVKDFKQSILAKKVVPHQVEIQPGPLGNQICWLDCPYCYGKSAINTSERLSLDRYIEIIKEIISGGCKKIIFAGWATDPLFYKHIDDLVDTAVNMGAVIGFNTRVLRISDRLVRIITSENLALKSYISVSINAGTNESYHLVNGGRNPKAKLYDQVLNNIAKIMSAKRNNNSPLDVSVSYLLNQYNSSKQEVSKFINDYKSLGVNLIRFSCPQIPRGDADNPFVPSYEQYQSLINEVEGIIQDANDETCNVILLREADKYLNARTLPCFARFIYPTIGYDGWLYHCSQSSGTNFRSQALGNLSTHSFWELYYNYTTNLDEHFKSCSSLMTQNNCRCDRKEHTVNHDIGQEFFK